ncbi:ABC transporter substrate-binding protein [Alkalihalobacterium alkalinitrilicum]|uniref:ABC transporter substrate-binding protein n=1 Tax=Alkalihalobacterium alkalinitrilicum TaxID=427920 RepID=UPI000995C9C3|nr:ABC transporter substrate-binding protein [Alkalihalobacterium alkalinitrilicum]
MGNKSIKNFLYLIVSIVVLSLLVACSNSQVSNDTDTNTPTPNDEATNDNPKSNDSIEVSQGITDTEILIGHIGPQTGPAAVYDMVRQGIQSYFNYVNDNGGVDGRQLKLIAYDDQYQPSRTVQMATRLVEEDKVFALVGNVGTAANLSALPVYEKTGATVVGVSSGASDLVNPTIPNFFSGLMNYNIEARIYLEYIVNEMNAKKIFISYQNDDSGLDFLSGVHESIGNYDGVEIVAEIPHLATDTDFSSIAQRIQRTNPDVVVVLSTPNPAANLKREMYRIGLTDIPYVVSAVGGNDTNLYNLVGEDIWTGTISSTSIIHPDISDDPDIKVYVEQFSKDFPNTPYSSGIPQWGWAEAQILVEALKRSGDNLTRENLITQLESFDGWEGSLYPSVTYSSDNHYGITTLYMTEAKDGSIVPITGAISYDPVTGEFTYED